MAGLTNPFWGAFAVQLGASDYMLGLLTSLPALANLLAQIPAAILVEMCIRDRDMSSRRDKKNLEVTMFLAPSSPLRICEKRHKARYS